MLVCFSLCFCFTETGHCKSSGTKDKFPLACMIADCYCGTPVHGLCGYPVPRHMAIPCLPQLTQFLQLQQHLQSSGLGRAFLHQKPWLERISLKKKIPSCTSSFTSSLNWLGPREKNVKALGSFPLWTCELVLLTPVTASPYQSAELVLREKHSSVRTLVLPYPSWPQRPRY